LVTQSTDTNTYETRGVYPTYLPIVLPASHPKVAVLVGVREPNCR